MSETSKGGNGGDNAGKSSSSVPSHQAQTTASVPSTTTSKNTNPLGAVLAGSQQPQQPGQAPVDQNAAMMMTNAAAAATIAAVAAQAVQHIAGQQQQQKLAAPPPSNVGGGVSTAAAAASLYAALQGNRNPLFAAAVAPPAPTAQVAPSHAALLAALTGSAGQQQPSVQGLFTGHDAASTMMRPGGAMLSHAAAPSALASPAALSKMQSWSAVQLGRCLSSDMLRRLSSAYLHFSRFTHNRLFDPLCIE